jgi:catechol 2,3-dioxygenase-like lactoylglutathione lyase family enzyme
MVTLLLQKADDLHMRTERTDRTGPNVPNGGRLPSARAGRTSAARSTYARPVLLNGFNHVAVITSDSDRLHEFYREMFDATVLVDGPGMGDGDGVRFSIVAVGPYSELNVFEIEGNTEASRQVPMFGRGRLDHLALQAESLDAFETARARLMERSAADDFVTDFGPMLSLFFRDPDGLECELCAVNPDAEPGVFHPPGTRAARYPSGS